MDRGWHRGIFVGAMVAGFLALIGQHRSGVDRIAAAPLSPGRKRAGIARGGADAHRGSAANGMLRGNCDRNRDLRRSGRDAAGVWAEYWVFVLQEVEASEGEMKRFTDFRVFGRASRGSCEKQSVHPARRVFQEIVQYRIFL